MSRRRSIAQALVCALLLAGCGSRRPAAVWTTDLRWGSDVSVGRSADGAAVGPLAAASGATTLALADSFGGRLLLWRWERGVWVGPAARPIPSRSPVVAVALAPEGGPLLAVAADAALQIWAVPRAGGVARLADLRAPPGDLRSLASLTVAADGTPVADVIDVTAEHSSRTLVGIGPGGRPHTVAKAEIARVGLAERALSAWSLSPPGMRYALAPASGGGIWIAGRGEDDVAPILVRLSLDGRILERRRVPELSRADFLGVDAAGLAYAFADTGTPAAQVVVWGAGPRPLLRVPAPPGDGPRLPHPAALAADGALLLLRGDAQGLHLLRLPPGSHNTAASTG